MKPFGEFRPMEPVVSKDTLAQMHLKVSSVAELNAQTSQEVCIFTKSDGSYRTGDIVSRNGTEWKKIESEKTGVDNVRKLRGYKLGTNAVLRWQEPLDTFDLSGNTISSWDHTILVRKCGSEPTSIYDGKQVYINYKRNQFNDVGTAQFLDHNVPEGDGDIDLYYRAFAVAKNGLVSSGSDSLKLTAMPWDEVVQTIRDGHASWLFEPGDMLELPDGNELIVASINTATPYNSNKNPYLVTFLFKYNTTGIPFDLAKGDEEHLSSTYVLTKDKYANGGSYYIIDPSYDSGYRSVTPQKHTRLSEGTFYELVYPSLRSINGSNRWSRSDIREWLNTTKLYDENNNVIGSNGLKAWLTKTGTPLPPMLYLKQAIGSDSSWDGFLDVIVRTNCLTALPRCDGSKFDSDPDDMTATGYTHDLFFIPSVTEITGLPNGSYTEGVQFQLYQTDVNAALNLSLVENNAVFTRSGWWMRSAYQTSNNDTGTEVRVVNVNGNVSTNLSATKTNGCVVAFSIG